MNKLPLFSFLFVFLFRLAPALLAQAPDDPVDRCIKKFMAEKSIPGLAVAILRDGIPIKVKGYGWADLEHQVSVHPETIFQSGSIGKQFTAAAILLLKREGKLNLEDEISRYFNGSPATWTGIKVRHLLTHTSGIPDWEYDSTVIRLNTDYTEQELLEKAMRLPPRFKPGEKWEYCNTGYVLLGILIRQLTGRFYGDYLREKVFAPLSMETARVIDEQEIIKNRASGYILKEGTVKNQSWVSPTLNTTADGSIYLTILDLLKWDMALSKEKLLDREDLLVMFSPVKLNDGSLYPYGFAWFLDPVNRHRAYQHSGSWQGFNSYIAKYPDDRLTVMVLTNLNPSNPGQLTREISALYVPDLN